jgi:predicted MFS family arabinose efflux permease
MDADERRVIVGCIVVYSCGNLAGWLAPQILFGVMQQYHATAAQAGLLTLVEGVTAGLLSMIFGAYPPNTTHRRLAIAGLALYMLVNAVSPWASEFHALLGIRFLAGIADAMLIFVGVSLVAMTSRHPDRSFATINVAATIYGAAILFALPMLLPKAQNLSYLPFAAAMALLLAPTLFLLPAGSRPGQLASSTSPGQRVPQMKNTWIIFALLIAMMIPECIQSFTMFAFSPGIGGRLGMSEPAINTALSGAILASTLGPFAAAALARRFGRGGILLIAALLLCAANTLLAITAGQIVFRVCLLINLTSAYCFLALLLGWCAEIDPTGRYSSIMMGGVTVVTATSPAMAGYLVDSLGLDVLLPMVLGTGLALCTFAVLLQIMTRRQSAMAQPAVKA